MAIGIVTAQMSMQKGHSLPKTVIETIRNHTTNPMPPTVPAVTPHHIQRGSRPPETSRAPTSRSTAKAIPPMKELGTPSRLPCHTSREAPQETSGLTSQDRFASGSLRSFSSLTMSSQEAAMPMREPAMSSQP